MRRRAKVIKIINLNKKHKLNNSLLEKIILSILKFLKKPRGMELEVIFLDNRDMKSLNKRYKGSDATTDVLSFRLSLREFGLDSFLGEIFISLDRARHNAKTFGTKFENELTLYIIHGILHLFGYDDEKKKDKKMMSKKEAQIMGYLCKSRDLSKVLMQL